MSIERTLISRSQPYAVSAAAKNIISLEASKGCCGSVQDYPVQLESQYLDPIEWFKILGADFVENPINKYSSSQIEKRFKCWMTPEYALEWFRAERFLKITKGAQNRICFEIIGNNSNIDFLIKVAEVDEDLIRSAFNGEYSECEITVSDSSDYYCGNIFFRDYFPQPPYHHLLTRSKELTTSPFEPLIYTLNNIADNSNGFIQVIFEPVRNNWHQNVEILNDLEFMSKSINDPRSSARIKQQLPSGDIRNMARDVESKAHNDKPFFSVAVRSGIITDESNFDISGIASFMYLFQHGGNSLNYLTNSEYDKIISKDEIKSMLNKCQAYRPGFLLNSAELAGLIHLPSMKEFYNKEIKLNFLENPSTIQKEENKNSGIVIGHNRYADSSKAVIIEDSIRKTGTHIIGRSGSGKSTLMENMILQEIEQNNGLAVIDPHGDTIKRLLKLIPKEKIESAIYLDFGDSEFIPIWNPLKRIPGQSFGRTADDLVSSFKSIIKSNAWGDRLEHLLRNGLSGLLHLENSTFYDLLILFEQAKDHSKENKLLVNSISKHVTNPVAKRFWEKDYASYKRDDFTPPHHKLSKLLNSDESVSLMLSQPNSLINYKSIMDGNKILLLDLSNVGSDTRKILGSFLLTILHNHAISRNKTESEKRRPFSIYCDEAHKFTPNTLEDMITDARKFGINLTFAHQYLNQFNIQQRDALLSVGTTAVFNIDLADARLLVNNLQGKVEIKDIAVLKTGEAIARIGTEIIKLETEIPKQIPEENFEDEIITHSRENYYEPINEVKKTVNDRLKQYGFGLHNNKIPKEVKDYDKSNMSLEHDELK